MDGHVKDDDFIFAVQQDCASCTDLQPGTDEGLWVHEGGTGLQHGSLMLCTTVSLIDSMGGPEDLSGFFTVSFCSDLMAVLVCCKNTLVHGIVGLLTKHFC